MEQFYLGLVKSWTRYGNSYLLGARNTLLISLVGTFFGCLIGFAVGVLRTLPISPKDKWQKRFLNRLLNILYSTFPISA